MNTLTAYDKFVSKVNALDTSRGVNPDIRQFVFIFNEEMLKWVDERKEQDSGNIRIEGLQELQVPYMPLHKAASRNDVSYTSFDLPVDFFIRIGAIAKATHRVHGCIGSLRVELVKPMETDTREENLFHKPSFDMEQSIGFLASNMLHIFQAEDYTVDQALLSYYKTPTEIDLAGYIDENGNPSVTRNTELSTPIMNSIIDKTAQEFYVRNTDQIRTVLSRQQEQK